MKNIPKAVSWILHPVFLPVLFCLIVLLGDYYMNRMLNRDALSIIILAVVIFTLAIPALIFTAARFLKIIESFEMRSRQERFFAVVVTGMVSWFCRYILIGFGLPEYYTDFLLIMLIGAFIAVLVLLFKRFSLHVYGWSVCVFSLVFYTILWGGISFLFLPVAVVLAGLVAWARIEMEEHTPAEVYVAFGLGMIPSGLLLLL